LKILITGAAGFIGSHLSENLLDEGHQIVGFDNFDPFYDRSIKERNLEKSLKNELFTLVEGDLNDLSDMKNLFAGQKYDVVVHLAAKAGVRPSIENPPDYTKVNVNGTQNLLEMMKNEGIKRLLFASSSSVYGNSKDVPYNETMNVNNPISPYAATKVAAEVLCHTYWQLFGISATCLRFFTVYGPRQRPEMAIAKFIRKAYNGESISVFGDGTSSRDFTYIGDIIQGVLSAVDKDLGYEIINLGESNTMELNSLIALIEELTEKKVKKDYLEMQPGDVLMTYADISKARNLLNYKPTTDMKQGISKYIAWLNENVR